MFSPLLTGADGERANAPENTKVEQAMKSAIAKAVLLAALASTLAAPQSSAANLPAILATSSNAVPQCVTPGRLMAFLKNRYPSLPRKYANVTVDYMRHGEDLGLRWDYGFFQMLVETNYLKYTGDVRASQNNFAGLGATGGGVRGENFRTVSDGVRAHLEHILMYTGTYIDNPVADRTRKVQEWRVLDKWRSKIRGPMTYAQLTRKWAPPDRGYARDIQAIADMFYDNHCNAADPQPELLAKARGTSARQTVASNARAAATPNARVAAQKVANTTRDSLGAKTARATASAPANSPKANFTVLNGSSTTKTPKTQVEKTRIAGLSPSAFKNAINNSAGTKSNSQKQAPDAQGTTTLSPDTAAAPSGSCRVWQASYGGSRALIIKAVKKGVTNYTVLDVNAGREKREADAYISAYAKGGKTIEEFRSPKAALAKAFKLCPEK
ncbi:MAG: hypothetical protein AAFV69_12815 [Pseudomonadota bacterium]